MSETIRPTKKQKEILDFINSFILEHGYSPSYREIMAGLNYNSVATVALHVGNLVKRGHLQKRDYSARSLEVSSKDNQNYQLNSIKPSDEKWLVKKIEQKFSQVENSKQITEKQLDELYVLVGCLKVLEIDGAMQSFVPKLNALKNKN